MSADLYCPECGELLDLSEVSVAPFSCEKCRTELRIRFKHYWIFSVVSVLSGVLLAYIAGLNGPKFFVAVFLLIALSFFALAPVVLPLLPRYVEKSSGYIQKLNNGPKA